MIVVERDEILVRNTTWTIFIIIAFEVAMRLLDPSYQSDQSLKSQWFNFYRNIAFDLIVFCIGVFNSMQIRKNTRAIADQVSNNAVASANAGPVRAANELFGRLYKDSIESGVEHSRLIESLIRLYKSMLTAEELRSFNKERKSCGVSNDELVKRISVKLNGLMEAAVREETGGSGASSSLSDADRRISDDTEPVSAFDNTEPFLQAPSDVKSEFPEGPESSEGLEVLLKTIPDKLHGLGINTAPELMAFLRKLYSSSKSVK